MPFKTPDEQRRRYAKRRLEGLCVRCPRPSLQYARCLKCRCRDAKRTQPEAKAA